MLWNWLRRRHPAPVRRVVLYSRAGCHLCDDAWALLEQARSQFHFTLDKVDVDGDDELALRYGDTVPVVVIDGKERFRGRVNAVLLKRVFREA